MSSKENRRPFRARWLMLCGLFIGGLQGGTAGTTAALITDPPGTAQAMSLNQAPEPGATLLLGAGLILVFEAIARDAGTVRARRGVGRKLRRWTAK